jgi:hypothetical protein
LAPDALRLAWGEPDLERVRVDAVHDPVDPPEAERLVDGLRVGDAPVRGVDLVEPDDELGLLVVVLLEPRTQRGG